ncbi:gamma-glutamyltransferase family protein [Leptospira kobayashii]|nr:gamma-glutamyltransferase [Leptospira kobayashii]
MKSKLKKIIFSLLTFFILSFLLYYFNSRPEEILEFDDPYHTDRPVASGKKMIAATGHPYATRAALAIMEKGGNAADAGVAALLVLNVTQGEEASFPGVAPLLYFDSASGKVESYTGAGVAPSLATIDYFRSRGYETIPTLKYSSQLVPASPDVIIALLQKYGTMSFSEVSSPAIQLAKQGFPVHKILMRNLNMNPIKRFGFSLLMPYNAEVYLKGKWWKPLFHKEKFTRPELADTLSELADAEKKSLALGKSRNEALTSVRDYFYKGTIAEKIAKAHSENDGTMTLDDLKNYSGHWEKPLQGTYNDYTIFSNRTWNQGGIVPIVLQILEGIDLKSMGHNSPEYIHTVIQAIELAMADRDKYFGDPDFVEVPVEGLLSKEYAKQRRSLIQKNAFGKTPPFGNPFQFERQKNKTQSNLIPKRNTKLNSYEENRISEVSLSNNNPTRYFWERTDSGKVGRDTTYLSIIDPKGNSISLTPSDFPQSPMIPGDITLGIRMTQFRLDQNHPSALLPGKRPTITPNASLVFHKGKFLMSFGTPGGDMQTQATVQVFLNLFVFGMNPQTAVNSPRFRSLNWPDSFSPHSYYPGRIELEEEIYEKYGTALKEKGYDVIGRPKWEYDFGAPCISLKDPETGALKGAGDPRKESWAEGR